MITVSYPKFKSLEWKDENGKPVTYIGLRNKVFAHVSLPGCKGIPVNCRFYYNGYEGKTYLSALTPNTNTPPQTPTRNTKQKTPTISAMGRK